MASTDRIQQVQWSTQPAQLDQCQHRNSVKTAGRQAHQQFPTSVRCALPGQQAQCAALHQHNPPPTVSKEVHSV